MAHSHAETANPPCARCGRASEIEVWVIVDVDERPDLLERLLHNTIHEFICPYCGHTARINTPILILRPSAQPPILFSPARTNDPEQEQEQFDALMGMCQYLLGEAWPDAWTDIEVHGVPREALPLVLGNDPAVAAALAEAVEAPAGVPDSVRQVLEEILSFLTARGLRIQTPDDLARALEEYPELKLKLAEALHIKPPPAPNGHE